ncbi:MAG: ATPase [Desulfuromonadales bacterium]|nr:MAG: ATPase [Desulfuromonadales bacterium]
MTEKTTVLERMRKKALASGDPGSREGASVDVSRPRTALPAPDPDEVDSVPADSMEHGAEPVPKRKSTAFGSMKKKALGLISSRGGENRTVSVESEADAIQQPGSLVAVAEEERAGGNVAAQEPESASPDEDKSGIGCIEEPCAERADDDPQTVCSGRERIGWVSPAYTVSRQVRLDPQVVARNKCVAFLSDAAEVESYRVLRTQILQRSRERGGNTIMITSALPGEGKTLTAINLALTFAKEFRQTALLVDCDLRRQRIHELLGIGSEKGLNEYLLDDCPISDLMVWPGVEKLTVISGGRTISESSELLGSPRMKELVDDMKNRYPERYVIFDVPAVLAGADALAFAPLVDHIVVTVKAGETPMPEVTRALRMLPREKVLGLVLNRQRRDAA